MKRTWEWAKEKISERKNESVKNAKERGQASWFDNEVSTSRFYHPFHWHATIYKQTTN